MEEINKILCIINSSFSSGMVPALLFRGPAGTGKTLMSEKIAEILSAKLYFYQCFKNTDENALLFNYIPDENTTSGIKLIEGKIICALKSSITNKTVLVIDEFDKTSPSCDAFFLDLIQKCRVSTPIKECEDIIGCKENLVIIFTSNDMREFSEPFMRRVSVVKFEYFTADYIRSVIFKKTKCEEHLDLLVQVYLDTLNSGIRVATIPELLNLHSYLHIASHTQSLSWDEMLYTFIVKDDDSFELFKEYVSSRKIKIKEKEKEKDDKLFKAYNVTINNIDDNDNDNNDENNNENEKIPYLKIIKRIKKEAPISEDKPVACYIKNNTENITKMALTYDPSDSINKIEKWTIHRDFITRSAPIFLYSDLLERLETVEYIYARGPIFCSEKTLIEILRCLIKSYNFTVEQWMKKEYLIKNKDDIILIKRKKYRNILYYDVHMNYKNIETFKRFMEQINNDFGFGRFIHKKIENYIIINSFIHYNMDFIEHIAKKYNVKIKKQEHEWPDIEINNDHITILYNNKILPKNIYDYFINNEKLMKHGKLQIYSYDDGFEDYLDMLSSNIDIIGDVIFDGINGDFSIDYIDNIKKFVIYLNKYEKENYEKINKKELIDQLKERCKKK